MSDKEDPVSQAHRKIIAMVAIGAIGFLIIISVYGVWTDPDPLEHPDPWYVYIERFQTLIGGLLAVGAAFVTISQMRKSDRQADKRHEDLMRLQMKEEILGLKVLHSQFYVPLFLLQDGLKGWKDERADIDYTNEEFGYLGGPTIEHNREFRSIVGRLNDVVRDDHWTEYRNALNSRIINLLTAINSSIETAFEFVEIIEELKAASGWDSADRLQFKIKNRSLVALAATFELSMAAILFELDRSEALREGVG